MKSTNVNECFKKHSRNQDMGNFDSYPMTWWRGKNEWVILEGRKMSASSATPPTRHSSLRRPTGQSRLLDPAFSLVPLKETRRESALSQSHLYLINVSSSYVCPGTSSPPLPSQVRVRGAFCFGQTSLGVQGLLFGAEANVAAHKPNVPSETSTAESRLSSSQRR